MGASDTCAGKSSAVRDQAELVGIAMDGDVCKFKRWQAVDCLTDRQTLLNILRTSSSTLLRCAALKSIWRLGTSGDLDAVRQAAMHDQSNDVRQYAMQLLNGTEQERIIYDGTQD